MMEVKGRPDPVCPAETDEQPAEQEINEQMRIRLTKLEVWSAKARIPLNG